ncbi:hypothetical protein ACKWTF_000651 [Chironomus riparius]
MHTKTNPICIPNRSHHKNMLLKIKYNENLLKFHRFGSYMCSVNSHSIHCIKLQGKFSPGSIKNHTEMTKLTLLTFLCTFSACKFIASEKNSTNSTFTLKFNGFFC